ncbi:MAG TPA: hypothetical protein VIG33_17640 [Pseudobdellovibrionaceae bacterium]|jgi:hypothetical protein
MSDAIGAIGESPMREAFELMLKQFKESQPDYVLFTTFNFSSSFFESNVLPLLAGNSADELRGGGEVRNQINTFLEQTKTLVVCDRSTSPEPKGDFRYGLLPVGLENGRFHPKIVLMAGKLVSGMDGLWLSVASGNLSLSGWAINREVIGITPIAEKHRDELQILLDWLLKEANRRIDWVSDVGQDLTEEGDSRQILQSLINAINALDRDVSLDELASEWPDLHLALPPFVRTMDKTPAKPLLAALGGDEEWTSATVISPYWAALSQLIKTVKVKRWRFIPSLGQDGTYGFPLNDLPTESDKNTYSFQKFLDGERFTHAKAILFEREGANAKRVLCIGSANFTAAALFHGEGRLSNIEAMLCYQGLNSDPWVGLFETLDKKKVGVMDDTDVDKGAPPLPPFDAEVVYDWKKGQFSCRLMIHEGVNLQNVRFEVAKESLPMKASTKVEQVKKILFRGRTVVRSFQVIYSEIAGTELHYQGLVTQLNAHDDQLGYRSPPRLTMVLDLLRSLDPEASEREIRRRAERGGDLDSDRDEQEESSFDFFTFFQATYKMRKFYAKHSDLDPFLASAPQGIPNLFRAIVLQPVANEEAEVGRYVQLAELLETAESFAKQANFQCQNVNDCLNSIREELEEIEEKMRALIESSNALRVMFGRNAGETKGHRFLRWFREELKE